MKKDKLFAGLALSIGVALIIFITLASVIYAGNAATVYFDAGQGDKALKLKFRDGELNGDLPIPEEEEGYSFGGWYLDSEFTTEFNIALLPEKGKVNVYARWIPNVYTITLELNGGEGISELTAEYMTAAIRPENPEKFGYNFSNWYIDSENTNPYDFATLVTGDITLYADWNINQYSITFQTNGGSEIAAQNLNHDSILDEPADPTKADSVFLGWFIDEALITSYVFSAPVQSDITLYALWVPALYDIYLDYGTGNMEIAVGYNLPLERPDDPLREGYTFVNWYIDSEKTTPYNFDTLIDSEFTLYGDWTINSYTVTFTGAEGYQDIVAEYDTLITRPTEDPARYGYTFGGWYEGENEFNFEEMTVKHDIELYANWIPNIYRITLESFDGETEITYIDVTFDSEVEGLPIPLLQHYDLVGWNVEEDGAGEYITNGDSYITANDITLYAQYTYTHYDVVFDMEDGSDVESQSVLYLDLATRPETNPIKRGYTFDDWYSDQERTIPYDFNTPLESDITIYAGWIINVYTVTFFSEEEFYDSIDTNFNTTIIAPADPDRTGYDFLGWSLEEQVGEVFIPENGFFDFDTRIEDDTTLNAWWKLTDYYLNLNAESGTVNPDSVIVHYQFIVGNIPDPNRKGYTFIEWNTESDGSGDTYNSSTLFNSTSDVDLYAQWEINKYTITFESNGDSTVDPIENVPYNTTIAEPVEPLRVGHTFIGWFIDSGLIDEFDFETPIEDDITLYGGWSANLYQLIFHGQGGSEPINYGVYYSNEVGELPVSERDGYTFMGWNTKSDGSGDTYNSSTAYLTADNTDMYAQWQANQYTVTFDYQEATGGNTTADKTVTFDNQYGVLPIPSRTGYDFDGWFTESEGGDQVLVATSVTIPEDHTLYAQWTAKTYLLTFNFEGATGGMDPLSKVVTYDSSIGVLPEPERTGYTFEGWFTETDGAGDEYTANTVYTVADSSGIYADWEPIDYSIDYVLYSGTNDPINPTTYTIEDDITFLDADLTGYDFAGWFDYDDNEVTGITAGQYGDITLYASYEPIDYTVTFDYQGATGGNVTVSKVVTYDDQYEELPEPSKAGYAFNGWFSLSSGGTLIDWLTYVTTANDHTLYAQWTANTYTVIYNSNKPISASSDIEGETADSDHTYDLASDLTLNGYTLVGWTFEGWNSASDGTGNSFADGEEVLNLTTDSDGEFTLYAVWTANSYTVTYVKNIPITASGAVEGTTLDSSHVYDIASSLTELGFTLTGYSFVEWNTEADGTGNDYADETEVLTLTAENDGIVTLYAIWSANLYDMTYDPQGASSPTDTVLVRFDSPYGVLTTPSRTGYNFDGWFNESVGGTEITVLTKVATATNHTIYAHWTAITYTVTYNTNKPINSSSNVSGTTGDSSHTYDLASNLTVNGFTLTGWTFNGWNTQANGSGTAYAGGASVTNLTSEDESTVILYAEWTANSYSVTYNSNKPDVASGSVSGTTSGSSHVYDTASSLTASGFTLMGWTFNGWNTAANGSGSSYPNEADVCTLTSTNGGTVTLYAEWNANTYTVNYIGNKPAGASGEIGGSTDDSELSYDTAADLEPNGFTLTGWRFTGWNTLANGTGTSYDDEENVENLTDEDEGEITLYAQWEANNYTVQYNKNKPLGSSNNVLGTTANSSHVYDTASSLRASGYTMLGWTFSGWNTAANGSGTAYADSANVSTLTSTNGGTVTLYSQWTANSYTVSYNSNKPAAASGDISGSTGNSSHTYDTAKALTTNGYTLTGWTFAGWAFTSGGEVVYADGASVNNLSPTSGATVTIYAKWTQNEYTVTYNSNKPENASGTVTGSTDDSSHTYDTSSSLRLNGFSLTGWTFNSWNTSSDGSGTTYAGGAAVSTLSASGTFTLYAVWDANEYTVTFNYQGATGGTETANNDVAYDFAYGTLPEPTKTGYTLDGWFTLSSGGTKITSSTIVSTASAHTLYAQWVANEYTATFDYQGATGGNSTVDKDVTYDSVYGALPEPTRTGYSFDGWFTLSSGGTEVTALTILTTASDHTLYAQWIANEYTVTFDYQGATGGSGTADKDVTYDSAYGVLPVPTRTGYAFDGWFTLSSGGTEVTSLSTVSTASDHTIYAQWTANTYTVTYNSNKPASASGAISGTTADSSHTYDLAANLNANGYALTGWTFTGWATASDGVKAYDNVASVSNLTATDLATVTLYAVWTANTYTVTYNSNKPDSASGTIIGTTSDSSHTYDVYENLTFNSYTLTGWTFKGWATASDGEVTYCDLDLVNNLSAEDNATVTLYGIWTANGYTIAYNSNKPSIASSEVEGTTSSSSHIYDVSSNLTANGYSLTGWTFEGWNTQSDELGDSLEDEESILNLVDVDDTIITIYAVWNSNSYSIKYDSNIPETATDEMSGETSDSYHYYDYSAHLMFNGYALTGWAFDGWAASAAGAVLYDDGESVNNLTSTDGATVTLYAVWIANEYTVSYNFNKPATASNDISGTTADSSHTYDVAANLTTNGYSLIGWTFGGWATTSDGDVTYADEDSVSNLTSTDGATVTLYAVWTANKYTVSYNSNKPATASNDISGTTADSSHTYDVAANLTSNGYTLTGWTFDGWATTSAGAVEYDNEESVSNLTATDGTTVTLYAVWTANIYTINFNTQGGTVDPLSNSVTFDEEVGTLPTPTYTGYTFLGWFTEEGGNGDKYISTTKYTVAGHLHLYANWSGTAGLQYTATAGGYLVAAGTADTSGVVYIPVYHDGEYVVGVAPEGFRTKTDMIGIEFGYGSELNIIGSNAFRNCSSLNDIDLPDMVMSIGNGAFKRSGLKTFTMPGELVSIGDNAFEYCEGLTNITLESPLETIGESAFAGTGLTSFTLPESVVSIGEEAFYECALQEIYVTSLTPCALGDYAFYNDPYAPGFQIYVDSSVYDDYLEAAGWSDYSAYMSFTGK
jgi:uncharacterized repeat protein (TIGR02543 family)